MRRSRGRRGRELIAMAGVATVAMLAGVPLASADHDRGRVEGFAVSQQQPVQVVLADGSVADGTFRSNVHVLRDGTAKGSAHLEYQRRGAGDVARTERMDLAYESAVVRRSDEGLTITGTATRSGCGASADACALEFSITAHPEHARSGGDCLIYDIVGPNFGGQVHALGHTIGLRHEHTRPES